MESESGEKRKAPGGDQGPEEITPQQLLTLNTLPRYSRAKKRSSEVAQYMLDLTHKEQRADWDKYIQRVAGCASWLHFRHFLPIDEIRLYNAVFCQLFLLCPFCAMRRGAKQAREYEKRINHLKAENPEIRCSMVTLTVKNGQDLAERVQRLRSAFQHMVRQRKDAYRKNMRTKMKHWLGWSGSIEVKKGRGSGEWHPHMHIVVLHKGQELNHWRYKQALSKEWLEKTGDSYILDIRPLRDQELPGPDLVEVFKYALKFSDLTIQDQVYAWRILHGQRLLLNGGILRGVKVPAVLTDEIPDEDMPYLDFFFRYHFRSHAYSLESLPDTQGVSSRPDFLEYMKVKSNNNKRGQK